MEECVILTDSLIDYDLAEYDLIDCRVIEESVRLFWSTDWFDWFDWSINLICYDLIYWFDWLLFQGDRGACSEPGMVWEGKGHSGKDEQALRWEQVIITNIKMMISNTTRFIASYRDM